MVKVKLFFIMIHNLLLIRLILIFFRIVFLGKKYTLINEFEDKQLLHNKLHIGYSLIQIYTFKKNI